MYLKMIMYNKKIVNKYFLLFFTRLKVIFFIISVSFPTNVFAELETKRLPHLVKLGTASKNGTYWPVGNGICDLINIERIKNRLRCRVYSTGGSLYNIQALRSGQLDIALTRSVLAQDAYRGINKFSSWGPYKGLRLVAGLYDQPVSVILKQNSNILALSDLKGARVGLEQQGSGQRIDAEIIIKSQALSLNDVNVVEVESTADMSEAFCNGLIDVVIQAIAHPAKFYEDIIHKCEGELYSMSEAEILSIKKINPGLQKITLTPGLYGTKFPAIRTYGYRAVLVTTDRVSENVITKVIDSITSNLPQYFSITESFMPYDRNLFSLEGILVPIHVGAKDLQLALRNGG